MKKGRAPCCDKSKVKKGAWSPAEDVKLITYIQKHGHGNWRALPKLAGLLRCGKSCRLRWINYLRPDLKRGSFSKEEEDLIIHLHQKLGNRWSKIASHIPGRTDNEIKNAWNTHLKKKLKAMNTDSSPASSVSMSLSHTMESLNCEETNDGARAETQFSSCLNSDNNIFEVNEIKKEPNCNVEASVAGESEFWRMIGCIDDVFPAGSEPASNRIANETGHYFERSEYEKWLRRLEIELGLDATTDNSFNDLSGGTTFSKEDNLMNLESDVSWEHYALWTMF